MKNKEYIKNLLIKYYEGESSLEEETLLCKFLLSEDEIDADLEDERKAFRLLYAEQIPIPEGLSQRLEEHIDKHIVHTQRSQKRKYLLWISSVAASLILGMTLFNVLQPSAQETEYLMTDSFSDPQEAALVTQNALLLISKELNKGISGIEKSQEELSKLNKTLNKTLNKYQKKY